MTKILVAPNFSSCLGLYLGSRLVSSPVKPSTIVSTAFSCASFVGPVTSFRIIWCKPTSPNKRASEPEKVCQRGLIAHAHRTSRSLRCRQMSSSSATATRESFCYFLDGLQFWLVDRSLIANLRGRCVTTIRKKGGTATRNPGTTIRNAW